MPVPTAGDTKRATISVPVVTAAATSNKYDGASPIPTASKVGDELLVPSTGTPRTDHQTTIT